MNSHIVGFLTLQLIFSIGLNRNKLVKGQKFIERKVSTEKEKKSLDKKSYTNKINIHIRKETSWVNKNQP